MVRNSQNQTVIAAVLFAFLISGCQSSNNRWATAWKERTKPKPKFQGIEGEEEVTYWPYKADKSRKKQNPMPDEIREKLVRKNEQKKRDDQLSELLTKGDQLRVGGKLEDARVAYSQALQADPNNASVHHRLAIIADKQQKFAVADEHYQTALKIRPRDVNLLSDLGYSLSLRGDYQRAESTLKQALEIDRTHRGAMGNLGDIYAKQNRREEALAMFRAGTSEAAAQEYLAKLFPANRQGNQTPTDDWGNNHSAPVMAANDEQPLDYKSMSFDQVKAEMSRRGREAKLSRQRSDEAERHRMREMSAGEQLARDEQVRLDDQYAVAPSRNAYESRPTRGASVADDWDNSAHNSTAANTNRQAVQTNGNDDAAWSQKPIEIVRGNATPRQSGMQPNAPASYGYQRNAQNDYQQASNQGYIDAPQGTPQGANANQNASQYAAQLAMSVGPGSMFPVVANPGDSEIPSNETGSYNQRFGGEFQQPPAYQNPQGWNNNNAIEQTSVSDDSRIEGVTPIAPASPASNWGSPSGRGLNWQSEGASTAEWVNQDTPQSGAAGSGIDSGAGRLSRNQLSDSRRIASNQMEGDWQNQAQIRPGNSGGDVARPFNGAWPRTNSLPARQAQKPVNRGIDFNTTNGDVELAPADDSAYAPANYGNSNTPPMWKHAPNR